MNTRPKCLGSTKISAHSPLPSSLSWAFAWRCRSMFSQHPNTPVPQYPNTPTQPNPTQPNTPTQPNPTPQPNPTQPNTPTNPTPQHPTPSPNRPNRPQPPPTQPNPTPPTPPTPHTQTAQPPNHATAPYPPNPTQPNPSHPHPLLGLRLDVFALCCIVQNSMCLPPGRSREVGWPLVTNKKNKWAAS